MISKDEFKDIWDETLGPVFDADPDLVFNCEPHLKDHLIKAGNGEYTDDEVYQHLCSDYDGFKSYIGTDKEDDDVTPERLEEIFSGQPDKSVMTRKEYCAVMENVDLELKECQEEL